MSKTAEKNLNSPKSSGDDEPTAVGSPESSQLPRESRLRAAELPLIKEEKLAAIRNAIAKGDYDSDAILDLAVNRMLERLEASENKQ